MFNIEFKQYDYSLKDLTDQVIAAKRAREADPLDEDCTEEEWKEYLHRRGAIEVLPLSSIVTIR